MTEDFKMGRRLSDLSGSPEIVNLMLEMQQNSSMLKNVAEKVQALPELTRNVDVLVNQMEGVLEEVDSIESLKKLVDWHERLWKLIASMCTLLFPALLASSFWLSTKIEQLETKQTITEFKLQYMEKINEKSSSTPNSDPRVDELAWDLWNFDSPRSSQLPLLRTNLAQQQTKCELHSDWKLHLHL